LIDQPPIGEPCAPDAGGYGLQKTVENELGSIYDAAKDFIGVQQRFQAAPKFLQEAVAGYAAKRVSPEQVFDFRFALVTAEDHYAVAQTRMKFVKF